MRICGVDPGTNCGWSLLDADKVVASGTWDLKPKRHEGGGMRYLRFDTLFNEVLAAGVDLVAYEEVRKHMGVDAAHVYGGIVAHVGSCCEAREPKVPYFGIPVGTIKKFATGNGGAGKPEMIEAVFRRFGITLLPSQDDEADAIWIAACAESQYGAK